MINVMLICEYGMSTSMMEEAIRKEAKKRKLDLEVQAYSIADVAEHIGNMDYVLLGPQVAYRKEELIQKYPEAEKKLSVLDPYDFAMLNAGKVLNEVLESINNKGE